MALLSSAVLAAEGTGVPIALRSIGRLRTQGGDDGGSLPETKRTPLSAGVLVDVSNGDSVIIVLALCAMHPFGCVAHKAFESMHVRYRPNEYI